MLATYIRKLQRVQQLGLKNVTRIVVHRRRVKLFIDRWRKQQPLAPGIGHTWQQLAQDNGCTPVFERFFSQQRVRTLPFIASLYNHQPETTCIAQADAWVERRFSVLGSAERTYVTMPWHEDFRLSGQGITDDVVFDAQSLYADIAITPGVSSTLAKDIKVPWELSRLQHLALLGRAYEITNDTKYARAFADQVTDWIKQNPFTRGINWLCPMEVGLRALNLSIGFTYFRHASCLNDDFWELFICSLYDHAVYLEHNWELYDLRTSNHYLADLVGYLYLCWFFADVPGFAARRTWCHEELLRELDKQVYEDGTQYEQSTTYHRLVAELFYHYYCMSKHLCLPMPAHALKKLQAMLDVVRWCTPHQGSIITIGDNDSGKVTAAGLPDDSKIIASNSGVQQQVRHYPYIGLSVLKTPSWHISLRHYVHTPHQPTSHRHNDATSITLAYNGVPFIIDPGTYVYTASSYWRNEFRSVRAHSALYLKDQEPIALDQSVFLLNGPEAVMTHQEANALSMRTRHTLYAPLGYEPERVLTLHDTQHEVTITDTWHVQQTASPLLGCWQFIVAPQVQAEQRDGRWLLTAQGVTLELVSNQLSYTMCRAWYSPSYGVKVATTMLYAQSVITPGHTWQTKVTCQ